MSYNTQESLCQQAAESFSVEGLALYIAERKGENARPIKGGAEWQVGNKAGSNSMHVRLCNGKAVATDWASDGRQKDAIDWIMELEGIRDVGEAARRAMEISGMRCDAPRAPQPQPDPQPAPQPLPTATFAMLRRGIDEADFVSWTQLRHLSMDTIRQLPGIGYWPRKAATMCTGRLTIYPHSVVFWGNGGAWAKAIPLGDDGYRDRDRTRHVTTHGSGQWLPCTPSIAHPLVVTEGETAALALMSCGIQAMPIKPDGDGMARIKGYIEAGHSLYIGYDADEAGRGFAADVARAFPQIPDISRLWQCGKKPNGETDPDPNGYIVAIRDRESARKEILSEMERARSEMAKKMESARVEKTSGKPEKPEKKKKQSPRDVCNAFFEGWKYDEFYDECVAPDGKRYSEDQAESLAYGATDADVTAIRNAIKNKVKYGIGNQINGLYEHVMQMAETCTDADRGAIERFCERMGFDAYESRRVRLWLYQVIGRAAIPGEKTDGMLVIVSHEGGMSKTNLFNAVSRAMTGNRKAAQPFAFRGTKDELLSLATNCVVIIDEIDKIFKKKDVSELKAIITLEGADIRDPYARSARARRFCAVFGATSNDLNPIPTGEGDARRYWVVEPKKQIDITTPECESMLREAARDVISELDAHAHEYDKNSVVGKIWVETKEEYRETVARNNGRKSSSSASIAIETAARYVAMQPDAPWKDAPCSQGSIASCVETGSLEPMQVPSAQGTWSHPMCNASEVSRLIGQRIGDRRKTARVFGVGKRSGFTWRDIIAEFVPESDTDSAQDNAQFGDYGDYNGGFAYYGGY